ncbi:beta-lactamase family protein [Hymenobacter sp. HSC-4F20]|uniref:serine hydrolase domain-containing protein n=1 Tax=Hymenobacter sp. HSC-4F20 TaxID=2864135 RepID=UPI001C72E57A|nr:serine hydrolase domain-containing protein [Hymenobacter sp. HSC-4F20]MBX0290357.1 beta-lactamase family protein [Hymenobacter sp. HSC-4F20]
MNLVMTALLRLPAAFRKAQRQRQLLALMQQAQVPGLQLVHTHRHQTTLYQLGHRKSGTSAAIEAHTIFQAASLGKVMLAYTALRLHDRGVLSLDEPLLAYYPYPRLHQQPAAHQITARMVLTHTSGLPNWAEHPLGAGWATSPLTLHGPPGKRWQYSGEGYVFLQKTLEQLTGKPLPLLVQDEVVGPLHLPNSSFVWRPDFAATAASGHDGAGQPTAVQRFEQANAGFSLLSTAADYNVFLQAVLAGTGLKPATRALLLEPQCSAERRATPARPPDPSIAWACGVGLARTSRGRALWHWGNNGDFTSFFMAFPSRQESLVFFTNSANGLKLTDEVLPLFFGPGQYQAARWLAEEQV